MIDWSINGIEVRNPSPFTEIHIKIVKHLLTCYFKNTFVIFVASNARHRFKSPLHIFLFRNRVNRMHPKSVTIFDLVTPSTVERMSLPVLGTLILDFLYVFFFSFSYGEHDKKTEGIRGSYNLHRGCHA